MTVDGANRRPARRAGQVTLICVPTRPKHQHRQTRTLEFGVPFQPPRQEPSNSANLTGHGTSKVLARSADDKGRATCASCRLGRCSAGEF
jgi:hypothetical protein